MLRNRNAYWGISSSCIVAPYFNILQLSGEEYDMFQTMSHVGNKSRKSVQYTFLLQEVRKLVYFVLGCWERPVAETSQTGKQASAS